MHLYKDVIVCPCIFNMQQRLSQLERIVQSTFGTGAPKKLEIYMYYLTFVSIAFICKSVLTFIEFEWYSEKFKNLYTYIILIHLQIVFFVHHDKHLSLVLRLLSLCILGMHTMQHKCTNIT